MRSDRCDLRPAIPLENQRDAKNAKSRDAKSAEELEA